MSAFSGPAAPQEGRSRGARETDCSRSRNAAGAGGIRSSHSGEGYRRGEMFVMFQQPLMLLGLWARRGFSERGRMGGWHSLYIARELSPRGVSSKSLHPPFFFSWQAAEVGACDSTKDMGPMGAVLLCSTSTHLLGERGCCRSGVRWGRRARGRVSDWACL